MPVTLSLFLSVLGAVAFFGGLFALVGLIVEGRRAKAKPRFGVVPGDKSGTVKLWATWDPEVFAVQVYRFRFFHTSPEYKEKEGVFTVTLDPIQKAPFALTVELPPRFRELIEIGTAAKGALITVEMKTVEELTMPVTFTLAKFRKIYHGKGAKVPKGIKQELGPLAADSPSVFTLDYQELVARRKKLKDLEAAAKAKAAAKTAAPAKPVAPTPAPAAKAVEKEA